MKVGLGSIPLLPRLQIGRVVSCLDYIFEIWATRLATTIKAHIRIRGRASFLASLSKNPKVLDIGCGGTPPLYKRARPDVYYVGLDVNQWYNSSTGIADEYILTTPEDFPEEIEQRQNTFDAVVSCHNIEHCLFPERTLRAAVKALKQGGKLYLAFPCQESRFFPSRRGTLNFFDDPTHIYLPDTANIIELIQSEGGKIDFLTERHRPLLPFMLGLLLEPDKYLNQEVYAINIYLLALWI